MASGRTRTRQRKPLGAGEILSLLSVSLHTFILLFLVDWLHLQKMQAPRSPCFHSSVFTVQTASLSVCVCARSHTRARSVVSDSVIPWNAARQAPLPMGPSRQYWSRCHFLPQGIPNPGVNPGLLHLLRWQANPLPLRHLGSPSLKNNSRFPGESWICPAGVKSCPGFTQR